MKARGYSKNIRLLTFLTLLALIAGTTVYGVLTIPNRSLLSDPRALLASLGARFASASARFASTAASEKPAESVHPLDSTAPAPGTPAPEAFVASQPFAGPAALMAPGEPPAALTQQVSLSEPAPAGESGPPEPAGKTFTVRAGDTLSLILSREGVPIEEARSTIESLAGIFDPRYLKQGQQLTLLFFESGEPMRLAGLRIRLDAEEHVVVARDPDGRFSAQVRKIATGVRLARFDGYIESTLYGSATAGGLSLDVLSDLIFAYSFDVDFQRDIRPGDRYSVLYEQLIDDEGKLVRTGSILYAELSVLGTMRKVYRYADVMGRPDIYDEDGRTIRKTLLRTPIDVVRLTSGYGVRKHPIYGYSTIHRGLDFGAATGTPIRAAGDGRVIRAGWDKVYGNHVILAHPNEYETLYAHMSAFSRGMRRGIEVGQGGIIGYVGTTGLSTGPHLHYEVRHRRTQVNPATLRFPPGRRLTGFDLARFELEKTRLERSFEEFSPRLALRAAEETASGQ